MFSTYRYWHSLIYPDRLAMELGDGVAGFKRRVVWVFLIGVLFFAVRSMWGMNTENLTYILSITSTDDYTISRYTALAGSVLWGIVYIAFHFWFVAWIVSAITKIPYKQVLPLQLLVVGLLLIEKAIIFLVFALVGKTASVSFLSFGPLAMTFLENWYIIFFLNQLTIFSALIVALQYRFIRFYEGEEIRKDVIWALIALQIFFALCTAAVGFIPFDRLLNLLMIGGL